MEENKKIGIDQYLIIKLDKDEYGVDIKKVTTIIEKDFVVARVPKMPNYVDGVINLRGEIVPIISLRLRFGLPKIEDNEETRIIITKIEDVVIGFVVDGVAEVVNLSENDIESIANIKDTDKDDYLKAVGKIGNRIITLLDLKKLIKYSELESKEK
jgi:purine-binding chemotaxis protein CheW